MKVERNITELISAINQNAIDKGFWEDWNAALGIENDEFRIAMTNNCIATRLALIHAEVSEALEDLRSDNLEHMQEELADIVIRVFDLAGGLDIDLEEEILVKIEKNKNRPFKHNKLF